MSDWFFERDIQEDIEFRNIENQGFKSSLYQHEDTWLDKEWVHKGIEILTNPVVIALTIVFCFAFICILGGYNA